MILAIDIGNTNIVIGCCADGQVIFRERVSTNPTATVLEYAAMLKMAFDMNRADITAVDGAILSSVVPAVTLTMRDAVHKYLHLTPLVVGPGMKTGLNIALDNPATMGSDLVVGAAAALAIHDPPLIIIDMGTATTFSYLSESTYKGCVIIPGVRIAVEALSGRAAELPHISLEQPPSIFGRSTIDAMRSGVLYGNAAMIDGMIQRMEAEAKPVATVVMTGGNAEMIQPHCKRKILIDENLLLDGLYYLYQKNHERRRPKK